MVASGGGEQVQSARRYYAIKEIFYSLQGEGARAGRAAVFCRFAGCNLWSGRETDRPTATCRFCDTDFVGIDGDGGGRFASAAALADAVAGAWAGRGGTPYAVLTGGEPLLQVDADLIAALHGRGLEVALETNGTLPLPAPLDWVCVSPKAGTPLALRQGDELKLVYPQEGMDPADLLSLSFRHFFLQPLDGAALTHSMAVATRYCLEHPAWRLSVQLHKTLGIR